MPFLGSCDDGRVTTSPRRVAKALLDAQVRWHLDQLTGDGLDETIEREADEFFAVAAQHRLDEVLDPETVKESLKRGLAVVGPSPLVADLATTLSGVVHDDPAADEHRLADVVDRADVEDLVAAVLKLRSAQTAALDRLADSPGVGAVASRFVSRIVMDAVQQNREWAERLPGVSSAFSLGTSAARRMRGLADKQVEAVLGDATDRGARFAIRRINTALLDVLENAPVQVAAMEGWDLQAELPISDLYGYLRTREVTELAAIIHRLLATAAAGEYAATVVDVCVDTVFDRHGARSVADILDDLGVSRDEFAAGLRRHLAGALDALRTSSDLERILRERLRPFYESPDVIDQLSRLAPPKPPRSTSSTARRKA